jgi:UDP-N-acetylmuramate dehydrogenase
MRMIRKYDVPFFVLGGGSNLLPPDDEWNILAIQLDLCSAGILLDKGEETTAARLSVGAGVRLPRLMRYCLQHGLGGLEFLVGIPGMVGGALVMNAGTRRGSIADALIWLDVLDEKDQGHRLARSDLSPGYRSMGLPENWLILGCCLAVASCAQDVQRTNLSAIIRERKGTQPLGYPSAGCIFKNPEGLVAGALIERCGLKGLRVGDAEVSSKHANWIVNRGHAMARDVVALIEEIESRVELDFGVRLEREIRIIGT